MILHDYGNPYGADLDVMETLAKKVIEGDSGNTARASWEQIMRDRKDW